MRWAELTRSDTLLVRNLVDKMADFAGTGEAQDVEPDMNVEAIFPPYSIPGIYMALGKDEMALDVLEQGYEDGAFGVVSSILGPTFNRLRSHPRFDALLRRTGLEE